MCDVWQMKHHEDNMADGKAMYADDTTEPVERVTDVVQPSVSIVMLGSN